MAKSNKELAVEILTVGLQTRAIIASSPNFKGEMIIPSGNDILKDIKILTEELAKIPD